MIREMSLPVAVLLASSHAGDETPWWVTALVAAGSAVVGALIGGYASYLGNMHLSRTQQRLRAAIRRKAKVYIPLKLELQQLSEAIGEDRHVSWGIGRKDDGHRHAQEPTFMFWGTLVEDGRSLFAVSNKVRVRMEALAAAVDEFLRVRKRAGEAFQAVGQPLYRELSGNPMFHTGFGSHSMPDAYRDPEEPWDDWDVGVDISTFPEFRARFNEAPDVQQARADLKAAEAALIRALDDAIRALDDGIERISKREEKESPKD